MEKLQEALRLKTIECNQLKEKLALTLKPSGRGDPDIIAENKELRQKIIDLKLFMMDTF